MTTGQASRKVFVSKAQDFLLLVAIAAPWLSKSRG